MWLYSLREVRTMPDNEEEHQPPSPEDTPPTPDASELAALNERIASLETALSECSSRLQVIEADYTREGHDHAGYSPNEHGHDGYSPNEHTHETITPQENDTKPEHANFWFRHVGS
jgi:hypothetical protein